VFLIVGLGNPGPRYAATRHNIGFRVAEALAGSSLWRAKFEAELSQLEVGGVKLVLLKPQTFMNESGRSTQQAADFFRIAPDRVLVLHDELDLPFAQLKLKRGGGEAGHNGLRSVSKHLGTQDYFRLRLGVGRPPEQFAAGKDFVLDAFSPHEQASLDDFIERGVQAARKLITLGPEAAMNEVNRKR
jgi:peptidyl-tRNA hydrolase, PTH1 family